MPEEKMKNEGENGTSASPKRRPARSISQSVKGISDTSADGKEELASNEIKSESISDEFPLNGSGDDTAKRSTGIKRAKRTIAEKNITEETAASDKRDVSSDETDATRIVTSSVQQKESVKRSASSDVKRKQVSSSEKKPVSVDKNRALVKKDDSKKPTYKMVIEDENDEPEFEVRDRGGVFSTLIKAFVYIACVLIISIGLATTAVKWANDIFAFVKEEKTAEVTIPEMATVSEIADILTQNELIEFPDVFNFYVGYKFRNSNLVFAPGTYTLNSLMNYDEFIRAVRVKKAGRTTVSLTFSEGMTVDEIIDRLTAAGIGTREGYIDAIQNYPYVYEFMNHVNATQFSPDRKYRLEGYLFPDTYEFYSDSGEIAVIDKFLKNFEVKFAKENYDRITELGMTLDEVVILASIVEREAKYHSEFRTVSGVFHNRMNSSSFTKLESDATIQYLLPEHKEVLTHEDTLIKHPYNTYQIEGLPPGSICNPGLDAIMAALYPEKCDYYYFLAASDGTTVFSKTLKEHEDNINKLRNGEL
ncbi:MAG: endolytic transglycosylase MltG [Ruminococcaceae bacterium]|nr:endolytic transglycosylase MltG [Oscillospiraceae bacterium]